MTDILVRTFVRGYEKTSDNEVRGRYGTLSSIVGIFCNILLFVLIGDEFCPENKKEHLHRCPFLLLTIKNNKKNNTRFAPPSRIRITRG